MQLQMLVQPPNGMEWSSISTALTVASAIGTATEMIRARLPADWDGISSYKGRSVDRPLLFPLP